MTMRHEVAVGQVWECRLHGQARQCVVVAVEPATLRHVGAVRLVNLATGHRSVTRLDRMCPHHHWHFVAEAVSR